MISVVLILRKYNLKQCVLDIACEIQNENGCIFKIILNEYKRVLNLKFIIKILVSNYR